MPITAKDVPGIPPHGGALEIRFAGAEERDDRVAEATGRPTIEAKARRVLSDLELLAVGAVSPNRGFMTEADYRPVVQDMRLASGLPWSLPITLSATEEEARSLAPGQRAAIVHEGSPVAVVGGGGVLWYDPPPRAEVT